MISTLATATLASHRWVSSLPQPPDKYYHDRLTASYLSIPLRTTGVATVAVGDDVFTVDLHCRRSTFMLFFGASEPPPTDSTTHDHRPGYYLNRWTRGDLAPFFG